MARFDQLEIICPDGRIFFHDLDPDKGITTIGSHPDNDIVIDSPGVAPFQAVVDHQRKPVRFLMLSQEGSARMDDQHIAANNFSEVRDWQSIDLDGFTVALLESQISGRAPASTQTVLTAEAGAAATGSAAGVAVQPEQAVPAAGVSVTPVSAVPAAAAGGSTTPKKAAPLFANRPPDEQDELILVELKEAEFTVNVEQTASYELVIANGGQIVATFEVGVDGIDPGWINIFPDRINLNEGSRGTITVMITPPRQPDCSAGPHHLAFTISSPNYPSHVSRMGATLIINPFYDYSVGTIEPRQQVASWRKRIGNVTLPVANQGNSPTVFRLTAQDETNAVKFDFKMQENVTQVRTADYTIGPGESMQVPIQLQANKQDFVRLSPRKYSYSVSTQSLADPTASRLVMATFVNKPLFGAFSVLLAIIIAAILVYLIFSPKVDDFFANPVLASQGQPVTLAWKVSLFTDTIQIRYKIPTDPAYKPVPDEIKAGQSQLSVTPTNTLTTYSMVAGNWLSKMLPFAEITRSTGTVLVVPPYPEISSFALDKKDVSIGQQINVKWAIKNATSATLTVENIPTQLTKEEMSGEKPFKVNKNTLVILEAKNDSGSITQSEYVTVWDPKDLSYSFSITPPTVVSGNPVTVSWKVTGKGFSVDTVTVSPFTEPLPAEYKITYYPVESMYFVLKAKVGDFEKPYPPEYVVVTPADAKPIIDYFKATPAKLTSAGNVEFSWSVSGPVDSVTISNKSGPIKAGLQAQGFLTLPVAESATYVLTAIKGKQSAAAVVDLAVDNLREVDLVIKSIVPSSGILRNEKAYIYFSVTPKITGPNVPEVSGTVVITDGFDNCKVELPIASCEFIFHRSGKDKQLVATYSGDANYKRTTGAAFPAGGTLEVIGSTVSIKNIKFLYGPTLTALTDEPVVSQLGKIQFDLVPNGASTLPVQGKFDIFVNDTVLICATVDLVVAEDANKNQVGRGSCPFMFEDTGKKVFKVIYRGTEVYEAFQTDAENVSDQAVLVKNVAIAPTTIQIVSMAPENSAQVGQNVTMNLLVKVDALGGVFVPGIGTVKVTDLNGKVYCEQPVAKEGTVTCAFNPDRVSDRLIFSYDAKGSANYKNYTSPDSLVLYKITGATASVYILSLSIIQPLAAQVNPMLGQSLQMVLAVKSDVSGLDAKYGTVSVLKTDPVTTTPVEVCKINLPVSPVICPPIPLDHGGLNTFTTDYVDATGNYSKNKLASQSVTVEATTAVLMNIAIDPPGGGVEGDKATVSFKVAQAIATAVEPEGPYTVTSSGTNESCTGYYPPNPPTTQFCSITFNGNVNILRNIQIVFGDGKNYTPISATISNYKVLHKTVAQVESAPPVSPVVDGNAEIIFSVNQGYPLVGLPAITGTVRLGISLAGVTYSYCTATLPANSCVLTLLKPGINKVIAEYFPETSSEYAKSTSNPFILEVAKVKTQINLVSAIAPIYVDNSATYKVQLPKVAAPSTIPSPTGTAILTAKNLQDGTTTVCQTVISLTTFANYSEGSCSMVFSSYGTWELYGEYSGDYYYAAIAPTKLVQVQVVNRYPSNVVIKSTTRKANSTLVEVVYSVTKGSPAGLVAMTGSVTVTAQENTNLTCSGLIQANSNTNSWDGTCVLNLPSSPNPYTLVPVYSGDSHYVPATGSAATITIP